MRSSRFGIRCVALLALTACSGNNTGRCVDRWRNIRPKLGHGHGRADAKYAWAPLPRGKQEANIGFTVSFSIGMDSANKDAAWVLLTYLTGSEGMTVWTQGGVANPSRKDVPAPAGKEVLVKGSEQARPWSFIPGFSRIVDAFNEAMSAAVEAKSDDPTKIVNDTKAAIDQALRSHG